MFNRFSSIVRHFNDKKNEVTVFQQQLVCEKKSNMQLLSVELLEALRDWRLQIQDGHLVLSGGLRNFIDFHFVNDI